MLERGLSVLEEAIVGMVDREIGHRQQYQVSATSSTSVSHFFDPLLGVLVSLIEIEISLLRFLRWLFFQYRYYYTRPIFLLYFLHRLYNDYVLPS